MILSRENLYQLASEKVARPRDGLFLLPEKILQFGTGSLLRGLQGYLLEKANNLGVFNGRILAIKSTEQGSVGDFQDQDGLYTLCIRGIENGVAREENIICSSISRVLSAREQWPEVLKSASQPALKAIISNTTEAGIALVNESILQSPPSSFPAKLLAWLLARYKAFGGDPGSGMIIVPTELISNNGKILQSILFDLARNNELGNDFINWLANHNQFCNSLVDCIVPGKPDSQILDSLEKECGYADRLAIMSEPYRLWAIEGGDAVRKLFYFPEMADQWIVTEDITQYREQKLRLLNGTHSLSCGLAFLAGLPTVKEAMEDQQLSRFIRELMVTEIAKAIPCPIPEEENQAFAQKVLDRFTNPYIQHKWISISLHYSSKIAQRAIPVLLRYYELYGKVPERFALGFAGYLLFTRPIRKEKEQYFGEYLGRSYPIQDAQAPFFEENWKKDHVAEVVKGALQNISLWQADLTSLLGFEEAVTQNLECLLKEGPRMALQKLD